jgi:hypothetical protein
LNSLKFEEDTGSAKMKVMPVPSDRALDNMKVFSYENEPF